MWRTIDSDRGDGASTANGNHGHKVGVNVPHIFSSEKIKINSLFPIIRNPYTDRYETHELLMQVERNFPT